MNTNILQKCIDELRKEDPKIDYVLGMLETLNDIAEFSKIIPSIAEKYEIMKPGEVRNYPTAAAADEAAILDARAKAAIDVVKSSSFVE